MSQTLCGDINFYAMFFIQSEAKHLQCRFAVSKCGFFILTMTYKKDYKEDVHD